MTDETPSRLSALEQIVRNTEAAFTRIEARFDRIEARLERIDASRHEDFRFLVGLIFGAYGLGIAGFAALLGVMARGFHWI